MSPAIRTEVRLGSETAGRIRVLPLTHEELSSILEGKPSPLDPAEREQVRNLSALTRFRGDLSQTLALPAGEDGCLLLVGLGANPTRRSIREAMATAASSLPDGEAWTWVLPSVDGLDGEDLVRASAEGLFLSRYEYRQSSKPSSLSRPGPCTILLDEVGPSHQRELVRTEARCAGVVLTRDLVNTPAADLGPNELADAALQVAERYGFRTQCYRGDEVIEAGFRMVEAVGRASSRPSTVTVIETNGDASPEIALVGKGVVFDSGGLSIKPADGMTLMRKDMAGAATVLGTVEALGRLGVQVPFMAVVPATENMIGPDAFRPGDILTAFDGQTVEIGNTDAEGRLLLADALAYARTRQAKRLLDVATLTGAARVALGPDVPALFSNDEALAQEIERHSRQFDESVWRLPLVDAYDQSLDTPFADMNHISSERRGGAITAALFLRRFVGETPWAHLDLYGWEDKGRPDAPKGANGALVRTLSDVVLNLAD